MIGRRGFGVDGGILEGSWVVRRCFFVLLIFNGKDLKVFFFCREKVNGEKEDESIEIEGKFYRVCLWRRLER